MKRLELVNYKTNDMRLSRILLKNFIDQKKIRAIGGKGGLGCSSFLQLWSNDHAGPDGGDGGNGGHVILLATDAVKDLTHVPSQVNALDGEKGFNKNCHGKSAPHRIIKVPVGTMVIKNDGTTIADLDNNGLMFIAARGGAGGKGNHFFTSSVMQSPEIAEVGANGEVKEYFLEIRYIADIGLIGFPNAGKSTILNAISNATPKIGPYMFTTLRPYLGVLNYDNFERIIVADLPGLIPNSSKNHGLGIQFLKHIERCSILAYIVDISKDEPWDYLTILQKELNQYNPKLLDKPQIIVANKNDLVHNNKIIHKLEKIFNLKTISISAKLGTNIDTLLKEFKILFDSIK